MLPEVIDIEIYKPIPDKPGYSVLDYRRPIKDVIRDLNAKLKADGMEPDEYGFDAHDYGDMYPRASSPWPAYRWIACFAVTGGSEGHYIHIDVIPQDGAMRLPIAMAKTFEGWDRACAIAAAAGKHLGA